MTKQNIILGLIITTVTVTAFAASNGRQKSEEESMNSVAWFTANIPEARSKNRECFQKPELQSTPECKNSQHALEISYKIM